MRTKLETDAHKNKSDAHKTASGVVCLIFSLVNFT
jgi:hypothetical protein